MEPEIKRIIRVVVFLFAVQLAVWLVFFLVPQSKRSGIDILGTSLLFIYLAFTIYVIIWLVQYRAPVWMLVSMLTLSVSSLILVFATLYWDIGTKANFSVELTRFDAVYFSVGTLGGGTGSIVATGVPSRSLQIFQTLF